MRKITGGGRSESRSQAWAILASANECAMTTAASAEDPHWLPWCRNVSCDKITVTDWFGF